MNGRALLLALAILLPFKSEAAQADHIKASNAWIRLLPANLPAGGYVTLQNQGTSVATLVSVHSTAYASAMLHQSSASEEGGSTTMRMLDRLAIPAQGEVALAPAGYHLMLEQATHSLTPGDKVDVTLDFSDGSHLHVPFIVRPANASE